MFCITGQAFLACSGLITRKPLSQGFPKNLCKNLVPRVLLRNKYLLFLLVVDHSGQPAEQLTGSGIVFMQAAGAVVERHLAYGEQWVVEAGHLLAWSASYTAERARTGCRHYGPAAEDAWVCR